MVFDVRVHVFSLKTATDAWQHFIKHKLVPKYGCCFRIVVLWRRIKLRTGKKMHVFYIAWISISFGIFAAHESRFIDFICLEQILTFGIVFGALTESVHLVCPYSRQILIATESTRANKSSHLYYVSWLFSFKTISNARSTKHHLNSSISYGVIIYVPLSYHLGFMPVIYSCLRSISAKRFFWTLYTISSNMLIFILFADFVLFE